MDAWQVDYITSILPELTQDTTCNTQFWSYIKKCHIFSDEDIQIIKSKPTPQAKNSKLYGLLFTRKRAYEVLIGALFHTKQSTLVEKLLAGFTENHIRIPFRLCDIDITQESGRSTNNDWLFQLAKADAIMTPICYQGTHVLLETLCKNMEEGEKDKIFQAMDTTVIGAIINKGPRFILTKEPVGPLSGSTVDIYQDRTLTCLQKVMDTAVFLNDTTSVFVFHGINEDQLETIGLPSNIVTSDVISQHSSARYVLLKDTSHFKLVLTLRPNSDVYLARFLGNKFYLEYVKGNIEKIINYLEEKTVETSQKELLHIIRSNSCSYKVVISSDPLLGKTELLKSLATELGKTVDAFAAFLTLPEIIKFLRKKRLLATWQNVKKLLNDNSLDTPINQFKHEFLNQKLDSKCTKLFICVDDLDKVQTKHSKLVGDILKLFEGYCNNVKVIITTGNELRPMHKTLTNLFSIKLRHLSFKEKLSLLTLTLRKNNFGKAKARKCSEKVLQLVESQLDEIHNLTEYPGHCRILGEVIKDVIGSKTESNLLAKYYKVILFKLHVELIKDKFYLDGPIDRPYIVNNNRGKIFSCRLRQVNITYVLHLLAKHHFFWHRSNKDDNIILSKAKNLAELTGSGLMRINFSGDIKFIHKSIPDFLFAHYLFQRLNDSSKKYGILYFIFNTLFCVITKNVTIFEDMPQKESVSIPCFKFIGILYFLNYFIHEHPFSIDQKIVFKTNFHNLLTPQYFLEILSASIYSDFREIFEFCYMFYANSIEIPILPKSLHAFNPIRLAVINATIESFICYWTKLSNIGFDEENIDCFTHNNTPTRISIHYGIYDIFRWLRQVYGKESFETMHLLHSCTIGSVTCRDSEVITNRIKIIKLMLRDKQSDVCLLKSDVMSEKNRTAFLQPHTHINLLKFLINEGADVNELTYSDNSVLHLALLKDNFQQILTLNEFKTLFSILKAKRFQHFDKPNSLGYTPLHLLVKEGKMDKEILGMFRNAAVDMNKPTRKGKNILFLGTHSIHRFNLLLNFNTHITSTDYRGRTILHTAIMHHNYQLVKRILSLIDVDENFVNKQDDNGDTAMHYAVRLNTKHSHRIQLNLIKANINLHIENSANSCAIVEAFRNGSSLTVSIATIKRMDQSQYPINNSIASKCLTSLVINPKLDFFCIKSDEFLEIFRYMVDKCIQNKIEFGCLNRKMSANVFVDFLHEFVEENKAWDYLNPNDLVSDIEQSENLDESDESKKIKELRKQISFSMTRTSEFCYNLLKQKSYSLFYSFRQELRVRCDESILFIKVPDHLEKIVDSETETLVYCTSNTRVLIQRLRDCLGENVLVYPNNNISSKTSKIDILVVNVGANRQIFEQHDHFKAVSNKLIYVTSVKITGHEIGNAKSCKDSVCWNELSHIHQTNLKSKVPLFSLEENLNFSEDDYNSLNSNCVLDLISKSYVTLEVFCELLYNFYLIDVAKELPDNDNSVRRSINQKALETIFAGKVNNLVFPSSGLAGGGLFYSSLVDHGILVEQSEQGCITKFEFQTKFHCYWYVGRSLSLNHFDIGDVSEKQKLYHRLFGVQIHNVYIRSLYDLLFRDCDDNSICIVCFEFTYPVLLYFYDKYFQASSMALFSRIIGNTPKPYLSACIRANLCKLLENIFDKTPSWFQDEDFVFISIACSNLSTIEKVVHYFEESSKKSVRNLSLGRNSEITPLHVAVKRGNYEVVDYVLNTLQFKRSLHNLDNPALFRYCVSFTKTSAVRAVSPTEVESRWDIFQLLLSNLKNGENETSKRLLGNIFRNILVEVKNIHINLIKLLVQNGADVWDTDKRTGCNIAHLSPKYLNADEYLELAQFIIKQGNGQLFKSRNLSEESAVRCALRDLKLNTFDDEEKMCQILRLLNKEAGIQFNIPNKFHNKTILGCAKELKRSDKIIDEIIKLGGLE